MIFKSQQEILKFNNISVSCSYPKSGLEKNFLELENWNYVNVSFSQIELFK